MKVLLSGQRAVATGDGAMGDLEVLCLLACGQHPCKLTNQLCCAPAALSVLEFAVGTQETGPGRPAHASTRDALRPGRGLTALQAATEAPARQCTTTLGLHSWMCCTDVMRFGTTLAVCAVTNWCVGCGMLRGAQLKPAASELERLETALYTTRKSMAAEEVELQKAKAQRAVEEQQLAGLKSTLEVGQAHALCRSCALHAAAPKPCWDSLQKLPLASRSRGRAPLPPHSFHVLPCIWRLRASPCLQKTELV